MITVVKRDESKQEFNIGKISTAIEKAFMAEHKFYTKDIIDMLSDKKDIKDEEDFSNDLSKFILIPDFNITKIVPEKINIFVILSYFYFWFYKMQNSI